MARTHSWALAVQGWRPAWCCPRRCLQTLRPRPFPRDRAAIRRRRRQPSPRRCAARAAGRRCAAASADCRAARNACACRSGRSRVSCHAAVHCGQVTCVRGCRHACTLLMRLTVTGEQPRCTRFQRRSRPALQAMGRTLSWLCPPDMARLSRASLAGLANCGTPCMCAYTQRGQLSANCLEQAPCLGLHEGHRWCAGLTRAGQSIVRRVRLASSHFAAVGHAHVRAGRLPVSPGWRRPPRAPTARARRAECCAHPQYRAAWAHPRCAPPCAGTAAGNQSRCLLLSTRRVSM